jgi:hypothetical protein
MSCMALHQPRAPFLTIMRLLSVYEMSYTLNVMNKMTVNIFRLGLHVAIKYMYWKSLLK